MRIQFFLINCCCRVWIDLNQRQITGQKLCERDSSIFIDIENFNDSFYQRILIDLSNCEKFFGIKIPISVFINRFEPIVQFLYLFLLKLTWESGTHRKKFSNKQLQANLSNFKKETAVSVEFEIKISIFHHHKLIFKVQQTFLYLSFLNQILISLLEIVMRKIIHYTRARTNLHLTHLNKFRSSEAKHSESVNRLFKSRDQHLRQINKIQEYDVVIIGGGCNGVGAYLDATTRGLKTLLIEKDDFGSGTSSKSTKLFHGGVRYLEQVFQISRASLASRAEKFQLVNEAIVERGSALRNYQYLSQKIPFVIPSKSWFWTLYYWIGSFFYYLIYKIKTPSNTPKFFMPKIIGKNALNQIFPQISQQFKTGVIYQDGSFNDSRLLIMALLTAAQTKNSYNKDMRFFKNIQSNNFLNYAQITGLIKNQRGKMNGVTFYDKIHKKEYKIKAKYVINCTGVWSDKIRQMDNPLCNEMIIMVGGSHFTYDKKVASSEFGLCIPSKDGRVTLVVPWLDKVIVGTTQVTFKEPTNNPVIINQEKEFLRQAMETVMTNIPVSQMRKMQISQWTGLRPLVLDPKNKNNTKSISRDFVIEESNSGMLSLMGGKWTVFRNMGQKIIDRVAEKQNKKRSQNQKIGKSQTLQLKIMGSCLKNQRELFQSKYGSVGCYLFENYGLLANQIVKGDMTILYGNVTRAQIQWICKNEMVCQVEDVLLRRTRIAFTEGKKIALQLIPEVARIIGQVNNLHESDISELVVRGVRNIQAYDF